ncbi:MAG TPA: hypothetical protein PKM65_20195 [Spirochaetota bacterium]|nr:hypothetical protein [Spirochaetota bacterium]
MKDNETNHDDEVVVVEKKPEPKPAPVPVQKKMVLAEFMANSVSIRQYPSYLRDTFRRWAQTRNRDVSKPMTESEWESLFSEYANFSE